MGLPEVLPTLYLVVQRKSLEFKNRTDPAWIAQLHDPSDFRALEQAWQAATGRGRGQFMLESRSRPPGGPDREGNNSGQIKVRRRVGARGK